VLVAPPIPDAPAPAPAMPAAPALLVLLVPAAPAPVPAALEAASSLSQPASASESAANKNLHEALRVIGLALATVTTLSPQPSAHPRWLVLSRCRDRAEHGFSAPGANEARYVLPALLFFFAG
jgi:hypothetical protein